jgi:hypothetical protein
LVSKKNKITTIIKVRELLNKFRFWFNKTVFDIVRINTVTNNNINDKLFNPGIEREKSVILPEIFVLPISKGRALPVHSFNKNGYHPFVNAAKKALKVPKKKRYCVIKEYLSEYYSKFVPITAGHLMSSTKKSKLYKFPTWAIMMPWQRANIYKHSMNVRNNVRIENKENKENIGIDSGWAWTGPVAENKLSIESKRLNIVLDSILTKGYVTHNGKDGHILGTILIKDNNSWVWQSVTGQHRTSVLAALEFSNVKVKVRMFVRRDEVECWPQVVNGFYTINEAIDIFDKVFDGYPSENEFNKVSKSL